MSEQRGWKLHFPFLGKDPAKQAQSEKQILEQIENRKNEGSILEQEKSLKETVDEYNKIYTENFPSDNPEKNFKISTKRGKDEKSGKFVFELVLDNPPEGLFDEEVEEIEDVRSLDEIKAFSDKKKKIGLVAPLLINFERTDNPSKIKSEIEKVINKFKKEKEDVKNATSPLSFDEFAKILEDNKKEKI